MNNSLVTMEARKISQEEWGNSPPPLKREKTTTKPNNNERQYSSSCLSVIHTWPFIPGWSHFVLGHVVTISLASSSFSTPVGHLWITTKAQAISSHKFGAFLQLIIPLAKYKSRILPNHRYSYIYSWRIH